MKKYPKLVQDQINEAMLIAAYCDTLSSEAFDRGEQSVGAYWGRKAIMHYTRAEEISIDYDTDKEEQMRGSVR